MRRLALAVTTAATALSALIALPGAGATEPAERTATAAAGSYVALGDSYASGLGTRSYLADGSQCRRSAQAYPSLVAAQQGLDLDFRACSGATIPDVTNAQLGALGASTSLVTVSVGGNDAGFADVLTECATPFWAGDCDAAVDGAQAFIAGTLPGRLGTLYSGIRSRATTARVVVVGYPRVFMGEDCNALTWFSPQEQTRLNQTADQLNAVLAARAAAAGFAFVNPTSRFTGHAVCDDPEWLNGLSNPIEESYHPNLAGHSQGYTPIVGSALTGSTVRVTTATRSLARAQAPELAREQRRNAGLDAGIEPRTFRAPRLDSPQLRRAAERAGVDFDRWLARQRR
ncbi:SGNH/GDSL hydrolase family protein [Nocardioides nanhaiensis]|uniref:SGNH hydrolase-type esterase domain-containing protein n=1 Tax=Nocardioides nanhaiensis TaxID=1476871 RepID=A0ABP8VRG0_9ACTN